jgi:S1-C subfamily serine protease
MAITMHFNGLSVSTFTTVGALAIWSSLALSCAAVDVPSNTPQFESSSAISFALTRSSLQSLQRHAREITVKVMSDDNWGSGILIRKQAQTYTVLTNEHVLWIGDRFSIQTPDGKIYGAQRESSAQFGKNDLGLLRFTSPSTASYPVASLGCSLKLTAGTPVFAAGFPLPLTEYSTKGFKFTTGAISLITPKALEGGYQVGYSNNIEKGMSGGPVLNAKGEVIAVNGMHQEPLWGDPYIFQDGSKPSSILFPVLSRSSWAIPIETALRTKAFSVAIPNQEQCPAQVQATT